MNIHKSCSYLAPSSAGEFHVNEIGYGTKSVIENSLTLKAGDKIAHCKKQNIKLNCVRLSRHVSCKVSSSLVKYIF